MSFGTTLHPSATLPGFAPIHRFGSSAARFRAADRPVDPVRERRDLRDQELLVLLEAAARGDEKAFARLYDRTWPLLLHIAQGFLFDREAARDVLQECYVSIWQHSANYDRSRARPLTWMVAIVRNRCIDTLRARPDLRPVSLNEAYDHEDPALPPDQQVESLLDSAKAVRMLDLLAPHESKCLRLAYLHGYGHEDIASMLGEPLGTVKSWIRRSLIKLRQLYV